MTKLVSVDRRVNVLVLQRAIVIVSFGCNDVAEIFWSTDQP